MSAIGKGDWCTCLKSEGTRNGDEVVAGNTYYCETVVPWSDQVWVEPCLSGSHPQPQHLGVRDGSC